VPQDRCNQDSLASAYIDIQMYEGSFSSSHTMKQRSPGKPHPVFSGGFGQGVNGAGNFRAQKFSRRCETALEVVFFGEYTQAGGSAQEPIKGIRISLLLRWLVVSLFLDL
jgi:hypothetical protein